MSIDVVGANIRISFAWNPALKAQVETIRGAHWGGASNPAYLVPATPFHARQVLRHLSSSGLQIYPSVKYLANKDQKEWLTSDLDLSVGGLSPYPFQAGAVEFLDSIGGRGLICDEVGLGKTIEFIAFARHKDIRRFLIVCPASVIYKWEREIKVWYPEVAGEVQVITSGAQPISGTVHIISYDLMWRRETDLSEQNYKLICYDECHKLANRKTKRTKGAKSLSLGVPYLIGMTGTPIRNRPADLYEMLHLLDANAWNWYDYHTTYCGWKGRGSPTTGAENLDELEDRLRYCMIRRFKRQVSDQLPPFTRTVVPLILPDEALRTYRNLVAQDPGTIARLMPSGKGYFANKLDWLNAVRWFLEQCRAGAVADWAEDFLQGSDQKLVIYCGYKSTITKIEDQLYPYGTLRITGDVSEKERQHIIDHWQSDRKDRVLLITSAGGTGIDLFGKDGVACSTVVFAGRDWSPADEEQVEGRVDRLGQQFPVEAVYIVCQDTIDEDIQRLIEQKREIIKNTVHTIDVETSIIPDLTHLLVQKQKELLNGQ